VTHIPEIHNGDKLRLTYEGIVQDEDLARVSLFQVDRDFTLYLSLKYAKSIEVLSHGDPNQDIIGTVRGGRYVKLTSTNGWWDFRSQEWADLDDVKKRGVSDKLPIDF
jgi:hypothetical protein